ncbi:MAG TPA: NADAR family protein [Pseudonocardiaceae bacterium]|jgi:ribA/ribD-fused uncharacterized protein|nr:NADAR family protein [Pseudonocardiaceae bacterium]
MSKFLFFWGHRPQRDGSVGPGCLSQWWEAPFSVEGITYRTAEHFMMERKARLFGDEVSAERVLAAAHPGEAKRHGREVRGFDGAVWEVNRYDIVVRANLAKFGQHEDLREFLLRTGDRVLVEASPVDAVWGIGVSADDERATRPSEWPGLNLLGQALMDVRAALRG